MDDVLPLVPCPAPRRGEVKVPLPFPFRRHRRGAGLAAAAAPGAARPLAPGKPLPPGTGRSRKVVREDAGRVREVGRSREGDSR